MVSQLVVVVDHGAGMVQLVVVLVVVERWPLEVEETGNDVVVKGVEGIDGL